MFKHFKIGIRLAICFGAVVLLMLAIAAISLSRLNTTAATIAQAAAIREQQLAPLYDIRESLAQTGISARNAFIIGDDTQAQAELVLVERYRERYVQRLQALDALLGNRADFAKARDGLPRWQKSSTARASTAKPTTWQAMPLSSSMNAAHCAAVSSSTSTK